MKLWKLVFSPTGGTLKAANLLAEKLPGDPETVDLCDRQVDFSAVSCGPEDLALIAVPSFGGRVPAVAVQRIQAVNGNGAKAVLLTVYGNRAYEDTLVELEDAAKAAGFTILAGAAAIAEHSIARQFASGRPDAEDAAVLAGFSDQIARKLAEGDLSAPAIPGNRPYKKAGGGSMTPKPDKHCTRCGVCAAKCPTGAINPDDPDKVDGDKCIGCMRCEAVCPAGARKLNAVMLFAVGKALQKACESRKEPELFL